jgi:hypothetical protein
MSGDRPLQPVPELVFDDDYDPETGELLVPADQGPSTSGSTSGGLNATAPYAPDHYTVTQLVAEGEQPGSHNPGQPVPADFANDNPGAGSTDPRIAMVNYLLPPRRQRFTYVTGYRGESSS